MIEMLAARTSAAWSGVSRRAVVLATGVVALAAGVLPAHAAFSGTNGRIALGGGAIQTMTAEGRALRPVVATVPGATNPSISPDGAEVVFDANGDIWKAGMNGSTPVNLSGAHDPAGIDSDPDWTADGNGVVFTRIGGGVQDIYRMDADGSDPTNLTSTFAGTPSQPASGPGGSVVFTAAADLWSAPSTNLTNTPVVNGLNGEREPDVSPAGNLIAYVTNIQTGNTVHSAVFTMPGGGGEGSQVTTLADNGASGPASISPDGTKLLFAGDGGGILYVSNLDGSGRTRISGKGKEWPASSGFTFDWGPRQAGVETTPPDTEITKGPPKRTPKRKATFEFTGTDNASTPEQMGFECSLDGKASVVCLSPREFANLKKGKHRLEVRAVDFEGNVDPEPDVHRWRVT